MKQSTKQIAFLGLCTALALALAYIEAILPPVVNAVPGIKMGLPNIIIVFVLYRCNWQKAAAVSLVRVLLMLLIFGNVTAFFYSVTGAVLHNVGQILMAMLLLGTAELGYYLIVLAVTGTVAGVFIGLCGNLAIKRIPKNIV